MIRLIVAIWVSLCVFVSAEKAKILTYNVLADDTHKQRVSTLLDLLGKSDADIIALQEVDIWFYKLLIKQDWFKKYHAPYDGNTPALPRGLLILSKQPISKVDFGRVGGRQHRAYLTVETKVLDETFAVSVCHLESPLESGKVREMQMSIFFNQLKKYENAIFLGDFNFGDGESEEKLIPKEFMDVWLKTNPKENGYTWNREVSPMAKKGSFPKEKSRRLDRVLLKSKSCVPVKSEILGTKPIAGSTTIFPSDHFGFCSTIQKK